MSAATTEPTAPADDQFAVLHEIQDRVLWLSTAIVHHANRVRPNPSGVKVGGHQASSASMVSIMTALWFRHLRPEDRVSVKPHASPVLHAINYLLGELDASYLDAAARVRRPAELSEPRQGSRPRRLLDRVGRHRRDGTDLGRDVPAVRRHVGAGTAGSIRWSATPSSTRARSGRRCWTRPSAELGEIVWIVDLNRQSLDRVVPNIAADKLRACSPRPGGRSSPSSTGSCCEELFDRPGGAELRHGSTR